MHSTDTTKDIVVLIGLSDLTELGQLAKTGNCDIVGELIQQRDKPHPSTYLGKGKILELQGIIQATGANGIICDDELTNTQIKNLASQLNVKVMDRTILILDIFASNAKSKEAIVQVEIAQQRYNLSHLSGIGTSLSRLGGGIGTRGPGEKKLETDRRAIRSRIDDLSQELLQIETHRKNLRKSRLKNQSNVIALVGYTNAGKSSLMNVLTQENNVVAKNRLFSTLDTTTRKSHTIHNTLITDTVGFIQKLPTTLIKAFRSTLEELSYATILLHVVDISSPHYTQQMQVVYETLSVLNVSHIPIITVFNKIDETNHIDIYTKDEKATKTVAVSAKVGTNINNLINVIEETLNNLYSTVQIFVPYNKISVLNNVYNSSKIISEEHNESGTQLTVSIENKNINKISEFLM